MSKKSRGRDHPSLSSSIFDLSLLQQSKFVDQFCYQNAEDTSFLSKQFKKPFDLKDINKINTTSIGNLAYLALNSVEPYKTLAKNDLQTIRKEKIVAVHALFNKIYYFLFHGKIILKVMGKEYDQ